MAYSHILLYTLLLFLLPFPAVAQNNGTIAVGASLTADDRSTPWLSPSGDFAFGFQQLQNTSLFLLCIWYHRIPERTIVWYPNDESNPVQRGSRLDLTSDQGLVLSDPQGRSLWTSGVDQVAYGHMNDTGNFVLARRDSLRLWESFANPADTMLPAQMMELGGVIFSRRTETNFSRGRFQLRLLNDGNLVLNTLDPPSNYAYDAYYISGTYDPGNSTNSGYRLIFDASGDMYILRRNNERVDLTPQIQFPVSDYYYRATLNFDGVFGVYYHPKVFGGSSNWTVFSFRPDNICVNIVGDEGSGACGYNSVCSINTDSRPTCGCPAGYSLVDPNDAYGNCKPNFVQTCDEDEAGSPGDLYDLQVLIDTDWPTSDYELSQPFTEEQCRNSCLSDCFCAVAILRGSSCWKKKLPLSNGRRDSRVNGRAFMKYRRGGAGSGTPPRNTPNNGPILPPKKDQGKLILVGSVLLGSSVFINCLLLGAACFGFFLIYKKKAKKIPSGAFVVDKNICCFSYKELEEATDGFKDELGRGAFAIVYKGVIPRGGSSSTVAVKKLDRVAQDSDKEFKTEVNVIGQTHHKNLVRLIGFCDEGAQQRMLVYEYMSNGTLASFLFGDLKPSWKQRTQIALGIARGLVYLHEECGTQIIHCDIKPQNILLDDYHNARISDFGLAKLLMINQSRTNTGIRGTKGYVAPEWFRNSPITAKVDVYSFGVLLLEIICCRKSVLDVETGGEGKEILTDWVWDCFRDGRLDDLIENDGEAMNDGKKLEKFVMAGIWCIQEDPSLRPTMRRVSQMLEEVVEVAVPPCPSPFSFAR